MTMRSCFIFVLFLLAATFALGEASKRLILKDGSYQSVTKYEIQGNRVHYYSSERFDWEDLPKDLVDWKATEDYEKSLKEDVAHSAAQVDKEMAEDRAEEEAKTPLVAPNLRLPDGGGVYVMDYFHDVPELVQLQQSTSEIHADTKGNILRAAVNPLASAKQKIEVPGQHATVQVHVPRPTVYVNVEQEQPDTGSKQGPAPSNNDRYRFVRMDVKKDSRVLGNLKISVVGKTSQQEAFIPTTGETMSGGWIKVTPAEDLPPGEYAIAEMLNAKEMNLYVWDLGVNPAAQENASAWKPERNLPDSETKPQPPPTLNKRPSD